MKKKIEHEIQEGRGVEKREGEKKLKQRRFIVSICKLITSN